MKTAVTPGGSRCMLPGRRLFTAADVAALPRQLPSGPVDFELDNGKLVPRGPNSARHGSIQAHIGAELYAVGERHGCGLGFMNTGVVLWRDPDRVVGPDAAFVTNRSLPLRISTEDFLETVPELVVEVCEKCDSNSGIQNKTTDYLKAGVELVWIVDPTAETVVEHRPDTPPRTLGTDDTLVCADIIPGFKLPLVELFRS